MAVRRSTQTAVILVAGIGARLRPLTDDRPKALLDVGGETILHRAVRLLMACGVERIVLATGYRESAVRDALREIPAEFVFCHNEAFDRTQNSVSLALCRAAVEGHSFYKLDGDVVFMPEVLQRLEQSEEPLAVAVDAARTVDAEAMKVRVNSARRIVAFGKAIPIEASAGESIGIERIEAAVSGRLFDALQSAIEAARTDLYYEDIYSELISAQALSAEAIEVGDLAWTEVDTPEDLDRARALLSARV
jgi:choline kinase